MRHKISTIGIIVLIVCAISIAGLWNITLLLYLILGIFVWLILSFLRKHKSLFRILIILLIPFTVISTIIFEPIAADPNATLSKVQLRLLILLIVYSVAALALPRLTKLYPKYNALFDKRTTNSFVKGIVTAIVLLFFSLGFYTLGINPTFQYLAEIEMADQEFIINETVNLKIFHDRQLWSNSADWETITKGNEAYARRKRTVPINSVRVGLFARKAIIPLPAPQSGVFDYRDSKVTLILPKSCFLESKQSVLEKKSFLDKEYIILSANFDNTTDLRQIEFTFLPRYFRFDIIRQISLHSFSTWVDRLIFLFVGTIVAVFSNRLKNWLSNLATKVGKRTRLQKK